MAVELKLKYCPVCGSLVKFNYGEGVTYQTVTWRCIKRKCRMSKEDRPLRYWNIKARPNIRTRIAVFYYEFLWRCQAIWYNHKFKVGETDARTN